METQKSQKSPEKPWNLTQVLFLLGLSAFAVVMRFLPHLSNVTPIAAVALLSGFHFRKRSLATLIPLGAMFTSDLVIGLHSMILFVYAPILLMVFFGQWMSQRNPQTNWPVQESLGFTTFGAILFFLISNFGVWFTGDFYTKNFAGLMTCFAAGIPFFEKSLFGDMMFTVLLFSIYALICQQFPKLNSQLEMTHG